MFIFISIEKQPEFVQKTKQNKNEKLIFALTSLEVLGRMREKTAKNKMSKIKVVTVAIYKYIYILSIHSKCTIIIYSLISFLALSLLLECWNLYELKAKWSPFYKMIKWSEKKHQQQQQQQNYTTCTYYDALFVTVARKTIPKRKMTRYLYVCICIIHNTYSLLALFPFYVYHNIFYALILYTIYMNNPHWE